MLNRKREFLRSKWNLRFIFGILVIGVVFSFSIWNSQDSPNVTHRTPAGKGGPSTSVQEKPKFESPIFQALEKKDWTQLADLFAAPTPPADTKLKQLIYYLDTKKLSVNDSEVFFNTLMAWLKKSKFSKARESQLLSHVLGKLNLTKYQKRQVEVMFVENEWAKKSSWTQVSVGWVPMPDSTFQDLKALLKPGRTDLTADFVHFISKVKDEKAKEKLLEIAKKSAKNFEKDQKQYLIENLKLITASASATKFREY